jgi:hypothetical protein
VTIGRNNLNITIIILLILLVGGLLTGVLQLKKLGGGNKLNMWLSGIAMYVTMMIALLVGGERPVWVICLLLIPIVPVGYFVLWALWKVIIYLQNSRYNNKQ